jgi:hypothetical protein
VNEKQGDGELPGNFISPAAEGYRMARYERSYLGERRTVKRTLQLTPSEDQELQTAARQQGATFSDFAREGLLHRAASVVAATRRNPEAEAIINAVEGDGHIQSALGNNMNQIARHLNTSGDLRDWGELREALALHNKMAELRIAALERALAL